jgi:hypothetical protein
MKSASTSLEEKYSGLVFTLDEIQLNPRVPPEALAAIEQAHSKFIQNVAASPEIALQAYAYGLIIGSYISPGDKEVLAETDRLLTQDRQSRSGKASGERRRRRRWREHAKALAAEARRKEPSLAQEAVVAQIQDNWKKRTTRIKRHADSTLKKYVGELERAGELPRRAST